MERSYAAKVHLSSISAFAADVPLPRLYLPMVFFDTSYVYATGSNGHEESDA